MESSVSRSGDPLVDSYLEFVAGRTRPNTLRAVAHDLKTFFTIVTKGPADVVAADVFDFLAHHRGDRKVIRISDGESGLSARTIARRLSSVAGFYACDRPWRHDAPFQSSASGSLHSPPWWPHSDSSFGARAQDLAKDSLSQ